MLNSDVYYTVRELCANLDRVVSLEDLSGQHHEGVLIQLRFRFSQSSLCKVYLQTRDSLGCSFSVNLVFTHTLSELMQRGVVTINRDEIVVSSC